MERGFFTDFYRKEVEWQERQVAWWNEQVDYYNHMLRKTRRDDRELVKFMWDQGPLTKIEMETFGDDYQGPNTKYYIKQRRDAYKGRKKDLDRLEYAKEQLAYYERRGE